MPRLRSKPQLQLIMHLVELLLNVKSNKCVVHVQIVIKKVNIDVDSILLGCFKAAAEPEHFALVQHRLQRTQHICLVSCLLLIEKSFRKVVLSLNQVSWLIHL